jgi:hypothetical protein
MTARRIAAAAALAGAAAVAVGAGMVFLPAGLIVGGLEAIGAAYVFAYLGGSK